MKVSPLKKVSFALVSFGVVIGIASVTMNSSASIQQRYAKPALDIPVDNKLNAQRVELGKMLFFDPRLSGSNWISCATCHNPALGWSDGLPKGIGDGMRELARATPTILNTAMNKMQMWDGRFKTLEQQAIGPIESRGEMHQNPEALIKEIKAIDGYVKLFFEAYPGQGITVDTISKALASFERTIITETSPFDRWVNGEADAISDQAKRGFTLFEGKAKCVKCHMGYNFVDDGFHNIGLKSDDEGRFGVRPVAISKGAFKTPTLRDITKTAPYMHNGAYNTLEEVIEHYNKGGVNKSNLSPNITPLDLSKEEKADLLAFLQTLTGEPIKITIPQLPVQQMASLEK